MIRVAAKLILLFSLISAGVYLGYGQLEKILTVAPDAKVDVGKIQATAENGSATRREQQNSGGLDFKSIVRRNIFQASLVSGGAEKKVVEEVVPTTLDLTLLGTVTGNDRDARAIIVDNVSKQQEIYQIGDAVQGALIESIIRGKVTLKVHGKKEALFLKDREGGGAGAPVSAASPQWLKGTVPVKDIMRKTPRALPHRRISFRQNPESVDDVSNSIENITPIMETPVGTDPAVEAEIDREEPVQ